MDDTTGVLQMEAVVSFGLRLIDFCGHLVGRLCFLSAWLLSIFPVGHLSRTKILYLGHIQLKMTLWKVEFYFLFCSMLARLIEQFRVHKSNSEMFCVNKYNDSLSSEMRFRNLGEEILDKHICLGIGSFPHIACLAWMQTGRKLFNLNFNFFKTLGIVFFVAVVWLIFVIDVVCLVTMDTKGYS